MFSIWSKNFRGGFQKIKTSCRRLWISLPKFLCWEIWLAHNRAIFNQELDVNIFGVTTEDILVYLFWSNL
jgi:hypothetical protein